MLQQKVGDVLGKSSIYETDAWGNNNQPAFLNQATHIESQYEPQLLLSNILAIESILGRVRTMRWGPRIIDIDILFFSQRVVDTAELKIPHPGVPERKFVLVPLCEIAPDLTHPTLQKTIKQLLDECPDTLAVRKYTAQQPKG